MVLGPVLRATLTTVLALFCHWHHLADLSSTPVNYARGLFFGARCGAGVGGAKVSWARAFLYMTVELDA